jgi:hypothetical protein
MRTMTFAFRVRFELGNSMRIASPTPALVLATLEAEGEDVALTCARAEDQMSEARTLVLHGEPYASDDQAKAAAARWLDWLRYVFSVKGIGADFGGREYWPVILSPVLERGLDIQPDFHGVLTYAVRPEQMFFGASVEGHIVTAGAELQQAIMGARKQSVTMADDERIAYDMYGVAACQPSTDARFLLLMVALEALIPRRERGAGALAHVETLIKCTQSADLPGSDVDALTGSLRSLRYESIGQAGRAAVRALEPGVYMGLPPVKFFGKCYRLRSALVHGSNPLPTKEEVDVHAASLSMLVGDLIVLRHEAGAILID